jgi:BirA family biotin operon repressor/biotin-[acetyl-CoA-carboxylase] ligase
MFKRLFIGEKRINLTEINSTNTFMKQLIQNSDNEVEGFIVNTKSQTKGRGQQGNTWKSEPGKNLTFSIYLKPNILVQNQFILSKLVSLGITDFLLDLGLQNVHIKWPNDIYCGQQKIAGILIENALKINKVYSTVVGVGLNVNQLNFNAINNPTSIIKEIGVEQDLQAMLNQVLFFIEKRYISLKQGKGKLIDANYLDLLFGINQLLHFKVGEEILSGEIKGVNSIGKLQVLIDNQLKKFDLKEIEFLIN